MLYSPNFLPEEKFALDKEVDACNNVIKGFIKQWEKW
jgi:hypothetical protein